MKHLTNNGESGKKQEKTKQDNFQGRYTVNAKNGSKINGLIGLREENRVLKLERHLGILSSICEFNSSRSHLVKSITPLIWEAVRMS